MGHRAIYLNSFHALTLQLFKNHSRMRVAIVRSRYQSVDHLQAVKFTACKSVLTDYMSTQHTSYIHTYILDLSFTHSIRNDKYNTRRTRTVVLFVTLCIYLIQSAPSSK